MAQYNPTIAEVWHGRIDGTEPDQLRWHQIMQIVDMGKAELPAIDHNQQGIALLGFCSDEGVRRNFGRVGAYKGPAAIRQACCNFPMVASHIVMVDAGDILCTNENLEAAQQMLGEKVARLRANGYLPVVLGGGHEVAYGNFLGIAPFDKKEEFGVINFDAHFDLRPVNKETGATSGTWAGQIAADCSRMKVPFHYLVAGIQPYGNTLRFFELAQEKGMPYFLAEHFTNDQLEHMLNVINGIIRNADKIQLSLDMDVFSAPFAPGVSAPSFTGIAPNAMFKRFLRHIVFSGKVASVDIAEVNPVFDVDGRTSRLAAACLFDMVQAADMNAEYPG